MTTAERTGLDFDGLDVKKQPIRKGKQHWDIREDYSTRLGLQLYMLMTFDASSRMQEVAAPYLARIEAKEETVTRAEIYAAELQALTDYYREMADALAGLFKWSGYDDMTAEKVAETFGEAGMEQIAAYFFTLRMRRSSPPPGDSTTTSPPTSPSSETPTS